MKLINNPMGTFYFPCDKCWASLAGDGVTPGENAHHFIKVAGNKWRETRRMRASMESRLYKHDSEKTWKMRSCEQELQNLQPESQVTS